MTIVLPEIIAVGPQRTGTTWIYNVLKQFVCMPHGVKETMFFDMRYEMGLEWYSKHFIKRTKEEIVCEIAPSYFHNDKARIRIKELIPRCKIICTFRDPVQRLFSLYRLYCEYGLITESLESIIKADSELMETGKYASYLKKWFDEFGIGNVLTIFFDELVADPEEYVRKIMEFMGVDASFDLERFKNSKKSMDPSMGRMARFPTIARSGLKIGDWLRKRKMYYIINIAKYMGLKKLFFGGGRDLSIIEDDLARKIRRYYYGEIEELEILCNIDLTHWKNNKTMIQK